MWGSKIRDQGFWDQRLGIRVSKSRDLNFGYRAYFRGIREQDLRHEEKLGGGKRADVGELRRHTCPA